MKYLVALITLLAVTFVSCEQSQAPVEPQSTDNALARAEVVRDLTIVFGVYNACCDESVIVGGTLQIVFRENGSVWSIKGLSGEGYDYWGEPTGNTYTQLGTTNLNDSYDPNGGHTATGQFRMVNEDGCSFTIRITIHVTYNAQGEQTATVHKVELICD